MIRIGICADNRVAERIKQYISEDKDSVNKIIYIYRDSEEMVRSIESNNDVPDVLFCDIDKSFNTIKKINKHNNNIDMILLIPKNKCLEELVFYRAFAILTYPVKQKNIKSIMDKYLEFKSFDKNTFTVMVNKETYELDLDRINYFESRKRIIYPHGQSEDIHFYMTIRDLEKELLDKGFVRCHRSFLVNAKYVEEVHREYIIIKGEKIPVGRDYYEQGDGGIWKSLRKWNRYGAIIGVGGPLDGVIFRIKPEAEIIFGRDGRYSDIVINDDVVGEKQGVIIYHQADKNYSLRNVSGGNNIIINEKQRILDGEIVKLRTGDIFCTEMSSQKFELG